MIALLRGVLLEKSPNQAVVDAGGVGYEVNIPVSTFVALPDAGREVTFRVYTHVREDALLLYGFGTRDEKHLFERLISVSGIGPRVAITALSGIPANELTDAIRRGDVTRLVRIPGIGKKTAERIILELRDKLGAAPAAASDASPASSIAETVISALVNLGCARPAAEDAVRKVLAEASSGQAGAEFEPLFRKALATIR